MQTQLIELLFQQCDCEWRDKEYEDSIKTCLKILSIKPTESRAHNRLATNYKALKRIKRAIKHFRLAIRYDKNNETAFNNLGNIYSSKQKDWKLAQQCYIKAIAINSNYSSVHANYAVLLRKMQRIEDAKYHYLCALEINPNDAWIHFNFGNLMEEEFGDNDTASIHYSKCLQIDEFHVEAIHNFAVLLHKKREWKKAKKYYEKALSIDNESILTHRNYGLMLIALNEHVSAYYHLKYALSLCMKKDAKIAWNECIDFMDVIDETVNCKSTEILQLIQHIFNENKSMFEDYEEGKKILR